MQNSLKRLRKARGITLKELSQRSGFGVSTINNFENGRAGASQEFLTKIAKVLEVRESEIVSDEPKTARTTEDEPGYGRFDYQSTEGLRAAFEHVLAKMPLSKLIDRLSEIVNDESKTLDERMQMAQAIMPTIHRRKAELEAQLRAAQKAESENPGPAKMAPQVLEKHP